MGTSASAKQIHELGPIIFTRNGSGTSDQITTVLHDRLGSTIDTIDGGTPEMLKSRAYDAFGSVRTGGLADITGGQLSLVDTIHGFTQHEHADSVQLIHMGGRIYDYQLGRFLNVDPIIGNPLSSQSLNPCSYIGNNPLSGTDPTGYYAVDQSSICFHSPGSCGQIYGTDAVSALKSMDHGGSSGADHNQTALGQSSTPINKTGSSSTDIGNTTKDNRGQMLAQATAVESPAEDRAEETSDAETNAIRKESRRERGLSPIDAPIVENAARDEVPKLVDQMREYDPNYRTPDTIGKGDVPPL